MMIEGYVAESVLLRAEKLIFDILGGLAIMFLLGVGTMATQTLKAASANPAETLNYE